MSVDDVWRVSLRQLLLGQQVINAYYFRVKADPADLDASLLTLANDFKEMMRVSQNNQLSYVDFVARQVRGGGASYTTPACKLTGGGLRGAALTGTLIGADATADALPPADAMVLTVRTGVAGRSRRGRLYFGGWGENHQLGGSFTAATITAAGAPINTRIAAYKVGGTNPNWEWGVWSFFLASGCKPSLTHPHPLVNVQAANPTIAFQGMTEGLLRATVRTQRRRQLGVGS